MTWLPASATVSSDEGVSFATDLVHHLAAVRRKTETSGKVCDEFLAMLASRARVEEAYAKNLRKCASSFAPSTTPDSTLNEAMEALRGDLLNKAVQHEVLAKSILREVSAPTAEVRGQLAAETRDLSQKFLKAQKDLKTQEERYRALQAKYERAWHIACDRCGDARAAGVRVGSSDRPTGPAAGAAATASAPIETMGALTQWLLPTEGERRMQLGQVAEDSMVAAEDARSHAQRGWEAFAAAQQRGAFALQRCLAEHQRFEEGFSDAVRDGMRSMVVFESSALANSQYDLQMLMPCCDAVDKARDIAQFVASVREGVGGGVDGGTSRASSPPPGEHADDKEAEDEQADGNDEAALARTIGGDFLNCSLLLNSRDGGSGGALAALAVQLKQHRDGRNQTVPSGNSTKKSLPAFVATPPSLSPLSAAMVDIGTSGAKDQGGNSSGNADSGASAAKKNEETSGGSKAPRVEVSMPQVATSTVAPSERDLWNMKQWHLPILVAQKQTMPNLEDPSSSSGGGGGQRVGRAAGANAVLECLNQMGREHPVLSAALKKPSRSESPTSSSQLGGHKGFEGGNNDDSGGGDNGEPSNDTDDRGKEKQNLGGARTSPLQELNSGLPPAESNAAATPPPPLLSSEPNEARPRSSSRMFQRASGVGKSMSSSLLKGFRSTSSLSPPSFSSSASSSSSSTMFSSASAYSSPPLVLLRTYAGSWPSDATITGQHSGAESDAESSAAAVSDTADTQSSSNPFEARRQLAARFACCLYHRVEQTVATADEMQLTNSDRAARAEAEVTQALVFLVEGRTSLAPQQLRLVLDHCSHPVGTNVLRRTLFGLCCNRTSSSSSSSSSSSIDLSVDSSSLSLSSSSSLSSYAPVVLPAATLYQISQLMRRALNAAVERSQRPPGASSAHQHQHHPKLHFDWVLARDLMVIAFSLSASAREYAAMLVSTGGASVLRDEEHQDLFASLQGFGSSSLHSDATVAGFDSDAMDDSDESDDDDADDDDKEGNSNDDDSDEEGEGQDEAGLEGEGEIAGAAALAAVAGNTQVSPRNLQLLKESAELPLQPWAMKPEALESSRRKLAAEKRKLILERRRQKRERAQQRKIGQQTTTSTTTQAASKGPVVEVDGLDVAEAGDRSSGGGRSGVVFAYHLLRNHVVWRNPKLWDSIVAESCGGNLANVRPPPSISAVRAEFDENAPELSTRPQSAESGPGAAEAEHSVSADDVRVAQVAFLAFAMRSSGLRRSDAQGLLKRHVASLKLSSRALDTILDVTYISSTSAVPVSEPP